MSKNTTAIENALQQLKTEYQQKVLQLWEDLLNYDADASEFQQLADQFNEKYNQLFQ